MRTRRAGTPTIGTCALLGAVHATGTARAHRPDRAGHPRQERRVSPRDNRREFAERGIFALNLVSSPGSGKTTLLVRTIEAWGDARRSR